MSVCPKPRTGLLEQGIPPGAMGARYLVAMSKRKTLADPSQCTRRPMGAGTADVRPSSAERHTPKPSAKADARIAGSFSARAHVAETK